MSQSEEEVPAVGPAGAVTLVEEGALLLDVREPHEWEAGHAPQATHVPMGQVADHLDALPADRPVVCVCHVGGRSAAVAGFLRQAGLDARNLAGGMEAWAGAGLPVVDGTGGPGRIG